MGVGALLATGELAELEGEVGAALEAQDTSTLAVLGFGEISIALGWPTAEPQVVCKRTPPFTDREYEGYRRVVTDYVDRLEGSGQAVADTTIVRLDGEPGGGFDKGSGSVRSPAYLVQALLPAESLGHNVLRSAEPDPEHPFLVALTGALEVVGPTVSLDAQVTNFAWDGSTLTLVDVGTPFLWDDDGRLLFDMRPFTRMLPAPTRPLVVREMTKLVDRWRDPRRVATDIVSNLHREGLDEWLEPAVIALNGWLGPGRPVTIEEAMAYHEEDAKTFPRLKRLQAIERWWQTRIRRQRYEFFIESNFG